MLFFEKYGQFVQADVRSSRCVTPTTAQYLTYKHEAALPPSIVDGATVLDLGSCYGATGHWALSGGCIHYTGVEVQKPFAEKSIELLSPLWNQDRFTIQNTDVVTFLQQCIEQQQKFDVVVLMGVLYAFVDPYVVLRLIANVAAKHIIIDTLYPWRVSHEKDAVVEVVPNMRLSSTEKHIAYKGIGSRVSPTALDIFLPEFNGSIVVPKEQTDVDIDPYNTLLSRLPENFLPLPKRFIYVMSKNHIPVGTTQEDVASAIVVEDETSMERMPVIEPPSIGGRKWIFDQSVAQRFQQEALQHIPDYERVIDLCIQLVQFKFPHNFDVKIIDVGSALGHTVQKFIDRGYQNTFGVDNSQQMIDNSLAKTRIFNSNVIPDGMWDVVLINWTLHFVKERSEYLRRVYDQLDNNGMLVLTDKMETTPQTEYLYDRFKRNNGVSLEEIEIKRQSLKGVLETLPLDWYIRKLNKLGFKQVQVVNTRFMFNTIVAFK